MKTKLTKLEKNLALSKQQKIVDDLANLKHYADKYRADNRDMVTYDLKRAQEKMTELERL